MQEAVTRVVEWSRHHKMALNTEKCEVAFFTCNLHEARWQPTFHPEGQALNFTPPNLLGVTLNRALSIGQHVASITQNAGRYRVLISIFSKQWDWRKGHLGLSVLMYGAPAWQPCLAATRLERLASF